MFIAQVDFVPDMMMNLARKEIVHGGSSADTGSDDAGGAGGDPESSGQGEPQEAEFRATNCFVYSSLLELHAESTIAADVG